MFKAKIIRLFSCAVVLFAVFLSACSSVCSEPDSLKILAPGKDEVLPLLTDAQKRYLAIPENVRREKFAEKEFRMEMGLPAEADRQPYWPKAVRLAWNAKAGVSYQVVVRDAKNNEVVFKEVVKGGEVAVDNLEIAADYSWTVEGNDERASSTFRTEDRLPRLIRYPGVPNVRDLGGKIGLNGCRIRQGLVFRSAGLNENASKDEKPGKSRVDGANGEYIRTRFGIKTDIDLRSDEEVDGMTGSPLGETIAWHWISSASYGGVQAMWGRGQFAKVFRLFLDRQNYPIDFHCIAGQDRTGSVAFILGALLGLDEKELALDWEMTGFWNRDVAFRHERSYNNLVNGFKTNFPTLTIRESVEKYILSLGFTDQDIETFREIMLEDYKPRRIIRVAVYVGAGANGSGVYRHVEMNAFARPVEETLVDAEMIRAGVLEDADVLVIPGGSSPRMAKALGAEGREKIRAFVAAGGGYLGTCAGAVLGSTSVPGYRDGMLDLVPYATRSGIARPAADLMIRYTDAAKEILGVGDGARQRVRYSWGPVFSPADPIEGAFCETLATYDAEYADRERPLLTGKAAIVAGTFGKGRVFLSTLHPECDLDDHNILKNAFRFVSGDEIDWELPYRRVRGTLSVGVVCDESMGVETWEILRQLILMKNYNLFPLTIGDVGEGAYDWLDALIVPFSDNVNETPSVGLGVNTERTKAFLARGGKVIGWGPFAADYAALGAGVTVVPNGAEAVKALRTIDLETKPCRVAFYTENACSCEELAGVIARSPGFRVQVVTSADIRAGVLKRSDLLIVPGGSSSAAYENLGEEGRNAVKRFILDGGAYYGICAGAFLASKTTDPTMPRLGLVPWKDTVNIYPGFGMLNIKLTDLGKEVLGGDETRNVLYWGGPFFEPSETPSDHEDEELARVQPLATYDWEIMSTARTDLTNSVRGKAAILAGSVGKGRVYLQGPHPEMREDTFDLVRLALKYLTGREVTGTLPTYRRGQLVVGCEAPHDTDFAKFYLKLIGNHNVFYRNIRYGYPANDLHRIDILLVTKPSSRVFKREAIRAFLTARRPVYVVATTEDERKACEGVEGIKIFASYDELLANLI